MDVRFNHFNFNVLDLEKSIAFYDIDNDKIDKFTLNSDNTITYTTTYGGGSGSILLTMDKTSGTLNSVATGKETFGNFKLSLAK